MSCTAANQAATFSACLICRLLKLDVSSAQRVIVGDGTAQSLPFFSTELSPEAQDVRPLLTSGSLACTVRIVRLSSLYLALRLPCPLS